MGFSSYEDSKAEANRTILEIRKCVAVKKSSNKLTKRTSTIKKERFTGPKEFRQSANNEKNANFYMPDYETIQKSRSIEKYPNTNKLDGRKVITHNSCRREARTISHNSPPASNKCHRKRGLLELLQAIDDDIMNLKKKQLSISKLVSKSKMRPNANQTAKHENRIDITMEQYTEKCKSAYAEDEYLAMKPKSRTVGSQMNIVFDENRTDCGAFGDHILKSKAFIKAVGGDEAPSGVKDFITPLVTGGHAHVVNTCYGCAKPYHQCISSGACRSFLCHPQGCSGGPKSAAHPECCYEEYYYLNPQTPRICTQNCNCRRGHRCNCCQCKEKQLQKTKSYKRRVTDLNTQDFYYRKSESHISSKSSSPDKSKTINHQTNFKSVQNKGNAKTKETYEDEGLNKKNKKDIKTKKNEEHLKERKKGRNERENSISEVSESLHKIVNEVLGEESVNKLIHMLDHCTAETDKRLNAHKNDAKKEPIIHVSEAETYKVTSKERVFEISSSKPKSTTHSGTSPRYSYFSHTYKPDESYVIDPSYESQYPLETLRMLRKMEIKEYKATITPTVSGKDSAEIKRQTDKIKGQNKAKRYHDYIKQYKNHDNQKYDEAIQTENANDNFEEQLCVYGPASSGWDDYKKKADICKKKGHPKSKNDSAELLKDGIEKNQHIKEIKLNSVRNGRLKDLVGNEEKWSNTFSKRTSSWVYAEDISNTEPKLLHYKHETKSYLNGSKKGIVDESAKHKNIQGAGNKDDNKFNVSGKRRVNSRENREYHCGSEKPLHDLNLSSKFLTDNRQHIDNDDYYKNAIQRESASQGLFGGNRRNENGVNNIKAKPSQYYNSSISTADSRIQDVTEEIESGRSHVISPELSHVVNESKGINNKLETNYIGGTAPKDLSILQNKSQDVFTAAPCEKAISESEEKTLSKLQLSPFKTLVNNQLKDATQNENLLKIKGSRENDAKSKQRGEETEPSEPSTSQSIRMEEAKEATNHHFGFDNKECARSCENLSPNKIRKVKEGNNVLDQYSTNFKCTDCNSSLDTLRCLRDLLNFYQNHTLEDENLKALAEELLTNLSSNYSKSTVNYRASEDKSTLTWQDKSTKEFLRSDQELLECSKLEENEITTVEMPMVTKTHSNETVVDRFKEQASTILKPKSGSSHQYVSAINLANCRPNDIRLKTTQDLHTKVGSSNEPFKTSSTQSINFCQNVIASTDQCETSHQEVRGYPDLKQQMFTHRSDANSDTNLTSPLRSYYSYNTPEEGTLCNQSLTEETLAESKFDIPKNNASDDVCEQLPAPTTEPKNVNHMEAQPEEMVCEESFKAEAITLKNFDNLGNVPSSNSEHVYKQYTSTSEFKPDEFSGTQSESNYEYFELQKGSSMCGDRISDVLKTPKSPTYISTKVSIGTQYGFKNPSSSTIKYEVAHCESSLPLKSILKSCRPRQDIVFKESATHLEDMGEDANCSNITSIQVNFSNESGQMLLCQDEEIDSRPTYNFTQTNIENPTYSSNQPQLLQDKCTNHPRYPGELLNTSRINLPTFQHCPCMLNTYLNLLKTYYKSNRRPILYESLVNC